MAKSNNPFSRWMHDSIQPGAASDRRMSPKGPQILLSPLRGFLASIYSPGLRFACPGLVAGPPSGGLPEATR